MKRISLVVIPHNVVLYHATTPTAAASVALGIMDSSTARVLVPGEVPDFNTEEIFYLLNTRPNSGLVSFVKIDSTQVTDNMKDKRRLARLRGDPLFRLEVILDKALDRNSSFYDQELDAFLAFSLLRSGKNSGAVREYAETLGIEAEEAYSELLHRVETRGLQRIKNYATYCKHRNAINATEDSAEIERRVALVDSL